MSGRQATPDCVSAGGRRFRRDGQTWASYVQLGLFAFLVDGYAPTVPLLAEETGMPLWIASLHGAAFGAGMLIAGSLLDWTSSKILRRTRSLLGVTMMGVGVLIYVTSPIAPATLFGMLVAGLGASLAFASANAELAERHGDFGPRAVGEGAALSQGFGVLAPAVIGAFTATILGWRFGMLILPISVIVLVVSQRVFVRLVKGRAELAGCNPLPAATDTVMQTPRRITLRFVFIWLMNVFVLGTEFALSMWAPTYLSTHAGLDTAVATGSLALMLLGILIGRFAFAPFTSANTLDRILVFASAIFVVGFAVFWLMPHPGYALFGLFMAGFGISAQSPVALSRLIESSNGQTDLATAGGAVALGAALLFAPVALAIIGDLSSIRIGLLLAPSLVVLMLTLLVVTRTRRSSLSHIRNGSA